MNNKSTINKNGNSQFTTLNLPMKPGYKKTEIGVIPEGWKVELMSECSNQITDGEHLTPIRTNHGYYLLSARNILNGRIDVSDVDYVGLKEYQRIIKRCNPNFGDVLISCSGSIGRVSIVPENFKCVMVRSAALIKPQYGKVLGIYIQYFLQSTNGQNQIFASVNQGAQPNLFLNHIQGLKIPLPPLPEQTAIATVLSDTDSLIQSLEKQIAKKRLIKQGAMQKLLKPKHGWEVKKLGEIGKTFGGLSGKSKSDFSNGNSKYIPFMNIMSNPIIDINYLDSVYIKSNESQNKASKGDLFFNGSSETPEEVGLCSVLLEDIPNLYLNSFCFGFRLFSQEKISGIFLSYLFRSDVGRGLLYSLAQGATRYNLSKANFLKMEIHLPTKQEQTHIATILSDMDNEIETLEKKLAKYTAIKQGLMQVLLTGKIRLV